MNVTNRTVEIIPSGVMIKVPCAVNYWAIHTTTHTSIWWSVTCVSINGCLCLSYRLQLSQINISDLTIDVEKRPKTVEKRNDAPAMEAER